MATARLGVPPAQPAPLAPPDRLAPDPASAPLPQRPVTAAEAACISPPAPPVFPAPRPASAAPADVPTEVIQASARSGRTVPAWLGFLVSITVPALRTAEFERPSRPPRPDPPYTAGSAGTDHRARPPHCRIQAAQPTLPPRSRRTRQAAPVPITVPALQTADGMPTTKARLGSRGGAPALARCLVEDHRAGRGRVEGAGCARHRYSHGLVRGFPPCRRQTGRLVADQHNRRPGEVDRVGRSVPPCSSVATIRPVTRRAPRDGSAHARPGSRTANRCSHAPSADRTGRRHGR